MCVTIHLQYAKEDDCQIDICIWHSSTPLTMLSGLLQLKQVQQQILMYDFDITRH